MNAVIVVKVPDGDGKEDMKRIAKAGIQPSGASGVEAEKLLSLLPLTPVPYGRMLRCRTWGALCANGTQLRDQCNDALTKYVRNQNTRSLNA